MTHDEFLAQKEKILSGVPEEFKPVISFMAHSRGHENGYNEILLQAQEFVYDLLPTIKAFEIRIRSEKQ